MSGPSFDPGLQPEPCSTCGELVVRPRAGCPVCRARGLLGEQSPRALVRPACAPSSAQAAGWTIESVDPAQAALTAPHPGALRDLLAALGPLGEACPLPPRPLALEGERLLVESPAGASPAGPLADPASLLWIATDLARLEAALSELGLGWSLTRADLRLSDSASGLRLAPQALPRLRRPLASDPRAGTVAWGWLLAELLGAPREPAGVDLEGASVQAPPALVSAVATALRGEGTPLALLAAALGLDPADLGPGPRPAREARLATARAGAVATLELPRRGPLLVLSRTEPRIDAAAAWFALDLQLDAVLRLELPQHPDAEPAAVLARRAAFRAAAGETLPGPPLERALLAGRAPALRRDEPYALAPVLLPADPCPSSPALPAPPLLTTAARGSLLELQVALAPGAALPERVLLVRGRPGQPLLRPEDGELVRSLTVEELPARVEEPAPGPGARYAAFPLLGGRVGAPARTGGASLEVGSLTATPAIGAIELTWEAPPGAVVLLRAGPAPLAGPGDGEPLVWARERTRFAHDCLDAEQEVHYRVCALGPGGALSPGLIASARALGPPPALGDVRASSQVGRVTLAWTWPPGRSYDRVRVRREPGWPEGEREVARTAEPCLVDADAPLGRRLAYTLRTALGEHTSRLESEASGAALAEVAALRAAPAGGAVALELELPPGLPEGAEVQLVRNLEREPRDMHDGHPLTPGPDLRLLDAPLGPGRPAWYRACLVLDGRRSPGVVASATPVEPAGALEEVAVEGLQGKIAVRFAPPRERCERVLLLAAPAGEPLREHPCPAAGGTVELPATPGVPWRVRLVPVHQGCPDAGQAVEQQVSAWDDLGQLVADAAPDGVLLRWQPPAGAPAGYLLAHRPKGRADEPWSEVRLPGEVTEHQLALPPRRAYELRLRCAWDGGAEAPVHTVEATALALPPALGDPELSLAPGEVRARYLPAAPAERLHWERTVLYLSDRSPGQLRAALAGREWFRDEEAAGLGLTEAAARPRAKQRETLTAPAPATPGSALLASANGPLRRVLCLGPALPLPAAFLALTAEPAATPTLRWARLAPAGAQVTGLVLRRGLEEAALEGLPADELEELSLPREHRLEPGQERFEDADALPYVSWGYQLEATLAADGAQVVVPGPRLVVPALKGGTLRPVPAQARGFLGKKQLVEVRFEAGPPTPRAWPAFELLRCLADQREGKVVGRHAGPGAPPQLEDADLGAFTKGTRLTYRVRLVHARDRLGWGEGHASLTLG